MTQIVGQGQTLPPEIIRDAIVRVTDPYFPIELSAPVRLALTFLLRRVECANGFAEFWVKRYNFAESVGRCDKTITNWLNELEAAGLIVKEQSRTTWGAFRCLTVRMTEQAVKLLGLSTSAKQYYAVRKKTSHVLLPMQSKETVLTEVSENEVKNPPSSPPLLDKLPEDLRAVVREGLPASGVLKLMGLATASGKRLSDVVVACFDNIQKARTPYAYIRSLIGKDKDYAAIAAVKRQAGVDEKEAASEEEEVRQVWKYLGGCKVVWKGLEVHVGLPGHACQMYKTTAEGAKVYAGVLAGASLLRFIDDQRSPRGEVPDKCKRAP